MKKNEVKSNLKKNLSILGTSIAMILIACALLIALYGKSRYQNSVITNENKCSLGSYLSGGRCVVCPAGKYCKDGVRSYNCPAGTSSNGGAVYSTNCSKCPTGSYSTGGNPCRTCPSGQTSNSSRTGCVGSASGTTPKPTATPIGIKSCASINTSSECTARSDCEWDYTNYCHVKTASKATATPVPRVTEVPKATATPEAKLTLVITCLNPTYNGRSQMIATCANGTLSGAVQTNVGSYTVVCSRQGAHVTKICSISSAPKITATPLPKVTAVPRVTATPVPKVTAVPKATATPVPKVTAVPRVTATPVPRVPVVPRVTATPVPRSITETTQYAACYNTGSGNVVWTNSPQAGWTIISGIVSAADCVSNHDDNLSTEITSNIANKVMEILRRMYG